LSSRRAERPSLSPSAAARERSCCAARLPSRLAVSPPTLGSTLPSPHPAAALSRRPRGDTRAAPVPHTSCASSVLPCRHQAALRRPCLAPRRADADFCLAASGAAPHDTAAPAPPRLPPCPLPAMGQHYLFLDPSSAERPASVRAPRRRGESHSEGEKAQSRHRNGGRGARGAPEIRACRGKARQRHGRTAERPFSRHGRRRADAAPAWMLRCCCCTSGPALHPAGVCSPPGIHLLSQLTLSAPLLSPPPLRYCPPWPP
jgi:hypothetical protein